MVQVVFNSSFRNHRTGDVAFLQVDEALQLSTAGICEILDPEDDYDPQPAPPDNTFSDVRVSQADRAGFPIGEPQTVTSVTGQTEPDDPEAESDDDEGDGNVKAPVPSGPYTPSPLAAEAEPEE